MLYYIELLVCFPVIAIGLNILNIYLKNQLNDKFLIIGFFLILLIKIIMEVRVPYWLTTAKNTFLRYLYVFLLCLMCALSVKFDLHLTTINFIYLTSLYISMNYILLYSAFISCFLMIFL